MSTSDQLQLGTTLENRYQIEKLLAEGEFTRVYFAQDLRLKLPVVLKQMRTLYPDPRQAAEQVEQYQSEARLLSRLRHPSLFAVLDTFLVNEVPVLVAEYVKGSNLETIIETVPDPVEESLALKWVEQLCHALDYLHNQPAPIIVRGLQPSNLVLDPERNLRLIDFGLAKSMDDKGSGTRNIVKGLGEDGFAPLEQGAYSKTDARSDIYSLGATLYFVLTKCVPPSASRRVVAPEDPLQDARELNPTVSERTSLALHKMMKLRPQDRPNTALEALELFKAPPVPEVPENGTRNCVDCHIPLITLELDSVEIDRCEECGGLWLDEGELETLRKRVTTELERAENLMHTIPLSPDHPVMQKLKAEHESKKPFWGTLAKVLGLSR